ncbi:MAG: histidine kinase N-terminal 7TM domain-containing protein, partial [Halovenus sp.]
MATIFTVYQVLLVASFLSSATIAAYAWRHRDRIDARLLVVLFVGSAIWAACAFMATQYRGTPTAVFWSKLWFVGVTLTVAGFFVLSLEYTGIKEYVTPRTVALLSIEPIALNLVVWLRESWLWTIGQQGGGTVQGYEIVHGPAFVAHAVYSYLLLAVGVFLIGRFALRSKHLYQRQSTAILVAAFAPWIGNALYLSDAVPIDLTPIGFTAVGIAVGWAVWRAEFLDIMPIARDVVVDNLQDGMYVLDSHGRIVDINDAGREILTINDEAAVVGDPITQHLPGSVPVETFRELHAERVEGTVELSIGDRYVTVQTSPMYNAREEF